MSPDSTLLESAGAATGRDGAPVAPGPDAALVLFAHGSRDPAWRAPFERLAGEIGREIGPDRVALAYLEFEPPSLPEVLRELASAGRRRVRILPLFTASGKHVRKDLPAIVERVRDRGSPLQIEVLPPVGQDPRWFALLRTLALEAAEWGEKAARASDVAGGAAAGISEGDSPSDIDGTPDVPQHGRSP